MNTLAELLSEPPNNGEYHTIAIDGRGGAGKSTLARWLIHRQLEGFALSAGDDYYEPLDHELVPGYFNAERFMLDVGKSIVAGRRAITYKPFTWPGKEAKPYRNVHIEEGLVHEGVLSFALPINWDVKIWVDSPRALCLKRYLGRPYTARKASDRTPQQYEIAGREWARQADKYIAEVDPLHTADIVVSGTTAPEMQHLTFHEEPSPSSLAA
jgi:uridine kinase